MRPTTISEEFTSVSIPAMDCDHLVMKKIILSLIFLIMAINAGAAQNDSLPSGPVVDIRTSLGDIKVKLYDDTPIHRVNSLKNVREGLYNGVLFHRVIKDCMVQTGDPGSCGADSTKMLGAGDPGYTLEAEINYPKHYHKYGALAAARTGDQVNPERRSSGSQFYIVTGKKFSEAQLEQMRQRHLMDERQRYFNSLAMQHRSEIESLQTAGDKEALETLRQKLIEQTEAAVQDCPLPEQMVADYTTIGGTPHLDGEYTVFGEVLSGMDTVEKIQNVATGRADRPVEDVKVLSMEVEE